MSPDQIEWLRAYTSILAALIPTNGSTLEMLRDRATIEANVAVRKAKEIP